MSILSFVEESAEERKQLTFSSASSNDTDRLARSILSDSRSLYHRRLRLFWDEHVDLRCVLHSLAAKAGSSSSFFLRRLSRFAVLIASFQHSQLIVVYLGVVLENTNATTNDRIISDSVLAVSL